MTPRVRLLALVARPHRALVLGWTLAIVAITAATATTYQGSYASDAARHAAAAVARGSASGTAMYGELARPGTAMQFFAWEMGTFLTLLAAAMGILLALGCTRVPEESGTTEVVRSCGVGAGTILRAVLEYLSLVALVLGTLTALALGVLSGHSEGAGWPGAALLGGVVALTFLLFALTTCLAAQVMPTAAGARGAAWSVMGVAFLVRAVADTRHLPWLNLLSPLGLRALTRPYAGDRWALGAVALAACGGLAAVALAVDRRRELGAGLIAPRRPRPRRLAASRVAALQWRLGHRSTVGWVLGVAAIGGVFTALGSGAVESARDGRLDSGFLAEQLGTADPAAGYLVYLATVVGILAGTSAVLGVLTLAGDERSGRLATTLATGRRRREPLSTAMALAVLRALAVLGAAAVVSAAIAPAVLPGDGLAGRAFTQVLGQWPAMLALTGLAGLAVAVSSRLRVLAWLPLGGSAALVLLGPVLRLPHRLIGLGVFRHVPMAGGVPWPLAVLTLLGLAGAALAVRAFAHRDLAG